jgi:hypothetical protein
LRVRQRGASPRAAHAAAGAGATAVAAWRRWYLAAGPWRGYVNCPVLLGDAPGSIARGRPRAEASAHWLAEHLASQLAPTGTLCLLDLDPLLGVQVAAELSASGRAHVVLVIARWAYTAALLPTGSLQRLLIRTSQRLRPVPAPNASVVFVLDRARTAAFDRPAGDRRADNRYRLLPGDLPTLATLRQAGVQRIITITSLAEPNGQPCAR